MSVLVNHIWQSTLFAGVVWLLTRWLRGNSARVRHGLWLAASIKFLIPFSLLMMLGEWLKPVVGMDSASKLEAFGAADRIARLAAPGGAISADAADDFWLGVAGAAWLIGFLALTVRWLVRWRRVRIAVRDASPAAIAAPVPVRLSSNLREPGVVGIARPVLLLPAGIDAALTPQQLQAVIEHELSHVRRHDNLTAAIHMLAEAVFWFHPIVWWIGARLIDERERACDEAVIRGGSDPLAYAEGILRVCRSYVASDLACVSGVSGAALKARLEAIMKKDELDELSLAKRLMLGAFTLTALAAPVLIGVASPASAAEHASGAVGKIELLAGKRVKLDYQDVDVRVLIRAMGEAANVNILVSDKVSGTVTVKLNEMSWDQAFGIILGSQGLVKREKDGILFIEPAST